MRKTILFIICLIICNQLLAATAPTTIDSKAKKIAAGTHNLKPSIVKLAIGAFYNAQKLGIRVNKPIITVIDYSLPATEKRLWVVDLRQDRILYASMVAHGKNSGGNYTKKFSNKVNSLQTSMGLFLTASTYFGKNGYSLRMKGLEKGVNDKAELRAIVLHGAPYVRTTGKSKRLGRSWGCPAVEEPLAKPIINTIKNGTLILAYSTDRAWKKHSPFINESSILI